MTRSHGRERLAGERGLDLTGRSIARTWTDRNQLHRRESRVGRVSPKRRLKLDALPRVRAVSYYRPVVDEVLETSWDPDYVAYLWRQLRPHMEAKRARPPPPAGPTDD